MAYTAWSVIAGEQPTAAKWNILGTNDASFNDGSGFGANTVGISRLNAVENTDLFNGSSVTASTWTDFKGNQNFTVDNSSSVIIISIRGRASMGISGGGGVGNVASRIIVDSAGTPITRYIGGGSGSGISSNFANPFQSGGFVVITGLSAGTHTVKTQVYASFSSCIMYCRTSTLPDIEFFATEVVELKH